MIIAIAAALIGYIIVRQPRSEPLRAERLILPPSILGGIGLIELLGYRIVIIALATLPAADG